MFLIEFSFTAQHFGYTFHLHVNNSGLAPMYLLIVHVLKDELPEQHEFLFDFIKTSKFCADLVEIIGIIPFTGPNDPESISDILENDGIGLSNLTNAYFTVGLYEALPMIEPLGVAVEYYQPGYGPNATLHFKVNNF